MRGHLFELPSEVLQIWRHGRSARPALVLFSIHPLLERIGNEQKEVVRNLIATGSAEDFRQRGSFFRIDPALVPSQTVSAAIDSNLISELIWVIPTRIDIDEFSLEVLRKQLVDAGFLTGEEGTALTYDSGVARGNVRGIPFRAVHPDAMPDLEKPVILHVDTGFFKGMYKNEIATPLYDILIQTVMRISQNNWQVYLATLSYSTEEQEFSLDVRFMISALARLITTPALVQKMPTEWRLHSEAMYLGNMYMESKAHDLIEEAFVAAPEDPAMVYALSRARFQQGRNDEAFSLLDKAVEFDPGYGVAYLSLVQSGINKEQFDKALELQRKTINLHPENPFLKIDEAAILIKMHKRDAATLIINDLQKLPWSPWLHGNVKDDLRSMAEYASTPQSAGNGKEIQ